MAPNQGLDTVMETYSTEDFVSVAAPNTAVKKNTSTNPKADLPQVQSSSLNPSGTFKERLSPSASQEENSDDDYLSEGDYLDNCGELSKSSSMVSLWDASPGSTDDSKAFHYCTIRRIEQNGKHVNQIVGFNEGDSPNAYLNSAIFPHLLPAIENLLLEAKRQALERNADFEKRSKERKANEPASAELSKVNQNEFTRENGQALSANGKLYDGDVKAFLNPLQWLAKNLAKSSRNPNTLRDLEQLLSEKRVSTNAGDETDPMEAESKGQLV